MSTLRYLEGSQLKVWRGTGEVALRITLLEEMTLMGARVKRAFPLSEPERFLSIQDGDGKEVGVLRDLASLDESSQTAMREELDRRYFTPRILRIRQLRQDAGMWQFKVETQRGEAEFYVRNWRESAFEIGRNRWQIYTVDGARFEIPDLEALDAYSLRLMDQLL